MPETIMLVSILGFGVFAILASILGFGILSSLGKIVGEIAQVKEDVRSVKEDIGRVKEDIGRVKEDIGRMKEEIRYDISPSRRATIKGSIVAIVRNRQEVGVAFFISPTVALTAAHNLVARVGTTSLLGSVVCQRPDGDREAFTFDVAAHDISLDFAVLRLRKSEQPSQHYLPIHSLDEEQVDKGVFLVTCNIRLAQEASDITRVSVTIRQAYITNVHPNHLLYDSQAFDGDSGGAVVIGRSGKVLGLHKELVHAARELIERKEVMGDFLKSIEVSVKSLIAGSSHGCIGVRVDSELARKLIRAAE